MLALTAATYSSATTAEPRGHLPMTYIWMHAVPIATSIIRRTTPPASVPRVGRPTPSLRGLTAPPTAPVVLSKRSAWVVTARFGVRRQGRLAYRSEEHTSELQSLRHLVC